MSTLTVNGTFTGGTLLDGSGKHTVNVTYALPAHAYSAATLVIKWHVGTPYVNFWNYYLVLRVATSPNQLSTPHYWAQPANQPNAGPGTALEDDLVLFDTMRAVINAASGGTLTWGLRLDNPLQVPNFTTVTLDSAQLVLTYADTAAGSFAKRWSAAMQEGRAICCFVDTDNKLYVSTARDLKRQILPQSGATWGTAYKIDDHAADCNVGLHPNKGRGQIWYTKLDASNLNPQSAFVTSVTAGAAQDWSSATIITPQSSLTPANFTQPWTPTQTASVWRYVDSQSTGQGADACQAGGDKRLCSYPARLYSVSGTGGAIVANAWVCKDGGVGSVWEWRDLTASGAHNSQDGAAKANAIGTDNTLAGKTYSVVVGGSVSGSAVTRSAVVRAENGTLYQLVWKNTYARRAKLYPRPGTATATESDTYTNNFDNGAIAFTSLTNYYRMDVPAGSESIRYVRWNWPVTVRERALVSGTLNNPNKPTSLRFDIPALSDIPPYNDLGSPSVAYGGSSYLYASVVWDFTYVGASGLQLALTHDLTLGSPGSKYPTAQQAKTILLDGRGEFTGSATWDYYGNFDIDRARLSTIIFDVLMNGSVNALTIKSAKLKIHNSQTEGVAGGYGDTWVLTSAQAGSTATSLSSLYGGAGGELYRDCGYAGPTPVNSSLMDELNGQRGTTWDFNMAWTQNNGWGTSGANKPLPKDDLLQNEYAQCFYQANASDATKSDFFLVRSRDNGVTWEYAGEGARIVGLAALRDWNNANSSDIKIPSLLTERNVVYLVWVDQGKAYSLISQDAGDTWTGP